MSRKRRNETEEQRARRELISDFLSAANIQSMDDIQELFKEALAGFMEGSLESELDDELDVLYEFNHSGRTENCLLVIRIGLLDSVSSSTGVVAASAEGLVSLYQCSTSKLLYQSDVIYSSAFGETEEAAIQSAFKKLADIAYTLVKAVYV